MAPVNISEGRRDELLAAIGDAVGDQLLDVHRDQHHHRAVLTLAGEAAVRAVASLAVARLDLRRHIGVHPRMGVIDVVPFVPFAGSSMADAVAARDEFASWITRELAVPAIRYGEGALSLPEVRRRIHSLAPHPHPTAGAVAVGARAPLVAYNVWLAVPDLALARRVAAAVRSPQVRALGLPVGGRVQVSMNLIAPAAVGPSAAYDAVAARAPVAGAELVGLLPASVLEAVPQERWPELGLSADRTVEARLARIRR